MAVLRIRDGTIGIGGAAVMGVSGRTLRIGAGGPSVYNGFLVIAHRGAGALVYPEFGGRYWEDALARGIVQIEVDARLLSDGSIGVMHDATVDRTTSGTGTTATFSGPALKALTVDYETFLSVPAGAYGELSPPLLSDVLAGLDDRACLHIEGKTTGTLAAVVAALQAANIPPQRVILSSFSESETKAAMASGYPVMTDFNAETDLAALWADGFRWLFCTTSQTDETIATAVGMGFRVIPYTAQRRHERDRLKALGCVGLYSDDPAYTGASTRLALRDSWADNRWQAGMLHRPGYARGAMLGSGEFGYLDTNSYASMMLGFLGPIPEDAFTLRFKVRPISVPTANDWFGVFYSDPSMGDFHCTDFTGSGTEQQGNTFLFRSNGTLQTYNRLAGVGTSQGSQAGSAWIKDGSTTYIAEVEITPTTIASRLRDADGTLRNQLVLANAAIQRGGNYLHLMAKGFAGAFRDVELIPA